MRKFIITSTMKNGDKWVTNRDTKKEMSEVIQCILKDKDIIKIITYKKYLLASSSLKLILKKAFLFKNIFFGFA